MKIKMEWKTIDPDVGPRYYKLKAKDITLATIHLSMTERSFYNLGFTLPGIVNKRYNNTNLEELKKFGEQQVAEWFDKILEGAVS